MTFYSSAVLLLLRFSTSFINANCLMRRLFTMSAGDRLSLSQKGLEGRERQSDASDHSRAQSKEYNYTCIFVMLLPEGIDNILDLALLFSCQRETDHASQVLSLVPSSLFTKTARGVLFPWKQQKQNRISHHVQRSLTLPSWRGSC